MSLILLRALPAVALACLLLLPPAGAAGGTQHRVYVGGVGVLSSPFCGGPGSTALLGVCFALDGSESEVRFQIREDVSLRPVVGTALFVDELGAQVGAATPFCASSPELDVPPGAASVRVVLGPLPHVELALACAPGAATLGVVTAHFG